MLLQIVSKHMVEVAFTLHQHIEDEPDSLDWSILRVIFEQQQFSNLTALHICYIGSLELAEVSAWFTTALPECHARGILNFSKRAWWHSSEANLPFDINLPSLLRFHGR